MDRETATGRQGDDRVPDEVSSTSHNSITRKLRPIIAYDPIGNPNPSQFWFLVPLTHC